MPLFERILCPVDFSRSSRAALRHAVALACDDGAALTVLHVVDPLLAQAGRVRFRRPLVENEARKQLERLARSIARSASGAQEPAIRLEVGQAGEKILETAKSIQADLIVIGTHGLTGLGRLLLGSTAEHVLHRAAVPVLAIPSGSRIATGKPPRQARKGAPTGRGTPKGGT
jgi:nucleotide-binding universal stress UspA family protein